VTVGVASCVGEAVVEAVATAVDVGVGVQSSQGASAASGIAHNSSPCERSLPAK
jgi:hypothetical protein